MHFTEIGYQIGLFSVTFFIAHYIFNRFLFKSHFDLRSTLIKAIQFGVLYTLISAGTRYLMETYYTGSKSACEVQLTSGQVVSVPVKQTSGVDAVTIEPLNLEFDINKNPSENQSLTTISTKRGKYVFSDYGATLQSIDLIWNNNSTIPLLKSDSANFLIAFDSQTVTHYELIDSSVTGAGTYEIVFQAPYQGSYVQKKYILYDDSYRIDVLFSVPQLKNEDHVRLIVPMPSLCEQITGIVNKAYNSGEINLQTIDLKHHAVCQKFWFEPMIFGFSAHYFANICFNASNNAMQRAYMRVQVGGAAHEKNYQAILESKQLQDSTELSWSFYCGPKSEEDLKVVSPWLQSLVSYGFLGFLAKPLAKFLMIMQQYLGSYGWAIIIMTFLIKLLMMPFAVHAEKGMKAQAEFEKKRQHLQQKYKHDKEALDRALADLISKQGLPILSSCLPMLFNIPVFFALNRVLTSCTEMYGAPFLWIHDLTASDPYYILSILVFIGMIVVPQPQQQSAGPRQIFSKLGFGLLLAAITSHISAGLGLFIVINALFGLVQNPITSAMRRLM